MTYVNYDDIVAALPRLSQKQLNDLRTRCQFLAQRTKLTQVPIEQEDWLFLGIVYELQRRCLYVPVNASPNRKAYGSFQTASTQVRQLLELAAPGLDAMSRRALGRVAAEALANYFTSFKPRREVTFQNMMMHVSQTPLAITHAYPDYMESGLLGLVIRGPNG